MHWLTRLTTITSFLYLCSPNVDGQFYANCSAGRYATDITTSSCRRCGKGKYNALANMNSSNACLVCPRGKIASHTGMTSCSNCTAGRYLTDHRLYQSAHNSAHDCITCPIGKFSDSGASICADCEFGKFAINEGSTSCSNCPAGKYVANAAATSMNAACADCIAGSYNSDGHTCLTCNAGMYSTGAASVCTICPAGTFLSDAGTSADLHSSRSLCAKCSAGEYSNGGASTCSSCSPGKYLEDNADFAAHSTPLSCLSCPTGTTSPSKSISKNACGSITTAGDSDTLFNLISNYMGSEVNASAIGALSNGNSVLLTASTYSCEEFCASNAVMYVPTSRFFNILCTGSVLSCVIDGGNSRRLFEVIGERLGVTL